MAGERRAWPAHLRALAVEPFGFRRLIEGADQTDASAASDPAETNLTAPALQFYAVLYKAMKPLMMPVDVDRHELWQLAAMLGFHEVVAPLPDNVTPITPDIGMTAHAGLDASFLERARAFQATGIDPAMRAFGQGDLDAD